jgi:hypothetical protein
LWKLLNKAASARELVNTVWWNEKDQVFYSYVSPEYKLQGRAGLDLLYRNIVNDGPRMKGAVNEVLAAIKRTPSSDAVEVQAHQAEVCIGTEFLT